MTMAPLEEVKLGLRRIYCSFKGHVADSRYYSEDVEVCKRCGKWFAKNKKRPLGKRRLRK